MNNTFLANVDPSAPTDLESENTPKIGSDIDQQDQIQIIQLTDSASDLANVKAEKSSEIGREIEEHKQNQVETRSDTHDQVLDNEADNTMVCAVIDTCTSTVVALNKNIIRYVQGVTLSSDCAKKMCR